MDNDVQIINNLLKQEYGNYNTSSDVDVINQILSEKPQVLGSTDDNSWEGFKNRASELAKENNFPASVLLGQAALETGRGTSSFAKDRSNYFGYQAYDSNPDMAKKYPNYDTSIMDYINLIKNTPRYSWAYNEYLKDHDPFKLISNIKASGYATDPNYVNKVESQPEFIEFSKGGN